MKARNPASFPEENLRRHLSDVTIQVLVMLGLLVVLIAVTSLVDPNFFQPISLRSVSRDMAILSLLALGQAVVIISGGIDLSVGSLLCFSGILTLSLLDHIPGLTFIPAALIVLGVTAGIGMIHGLLICVLDLQPFMVTLCSLLFFRGLSRVVTGDSTLSFNPKEHLLFASLGQDTWFGVPLSVYVLAAAVVPLGFLLHFTVPGRYLFAIGYNLEAARFSGVRINALRILTYALCALLTTLAAFLETSSIGSITPSTAGIAYEMYAITAAVLGGCALRGGQGSLIGVVIGSAILRVIRSAVIFLNISTYWTFSVTGLVLLAAVIVDSFVKRRRKRV
ncbi:MAG: ABC transporter permease [Planctomycetes bacterium]|nr:ABC transporter permease [Planctomycetota bacterium]